MSTLKAGSRLRSLVCTTEVVVVKAPGDDAEVTCGGEPLVALDDERASSDTAVAGDDGGSLLGKRYVDEESGIELLCSKAGAGQLAVDGRVLTIKGAKPLPSTD
jgi:hypothetical protein